MLNKRQDKILEIIEINNKIKISQILINIEDDFEDVSKITINRDLKYLIKENFIIKIGQGRSVFYELSPNYKLIKPIDKEEYFKTETDQRKINEKFNFEIFSFLHNIFNKREIQLLDKLNKKYKSNLKKLPKEALKKEYERLTIELSWKSSRLEGNTYSLLETEELIKNQNEAKGHAKEEAVMILNHKAALDHIIANREKFKKINIKKIEEIHFLLAQKLDISRNLRKNLVRITGTRYIPLDNEYQIREVLEKTCELVNREKNIFSKAIMLMALIAYIQPFIDGNKRTSRLVGNAVLMAHEACPLSFRSIDEVEYKKAVILFYEQNNISFFKELFIGQFKFAVDNYFGG